MLFEAIQRSDGSITIPFPLDTEHVAKSKPYINNVRNSNANKHSLFSNGKQNCIAHFMSDGNRLLYTVIEIRVSGALKMVTEVMWASNVKWVSKVL